MAEPTEHLDVTGKRVVVIGSEASRWKNVVGQTSSTRSAHTSCAGP